MVTERRRIEPPRSRDDSRRDVVLAALGASWVGTMLALLIAWWLFGC